MAYVVNLVVGEESLRLLGLDASMDDDILALLPVNGGGNAMLVTELDGVDYTDDFVKVSSCDSGVRDGQSDNLLRVDDEDGTNLNNRERYNNLELEDTYGERKALVVAVGHILVVQHVIEIRNFAVGIRNLT